MLSARVHLTRSTPQLFQPNTLWSPNSLLSRPFRLTASANEFHFDTHHFVQRLEREGLTRSQAEGVMAAMAEVIDESIKNMASNMVTKADQEKVIIIILNLDSESLKLILYL
jgi:hypothetical protein